MDHSNLQIVFSTIKSSAIESEYTCRGATGAPDAWHSPEKTTGPVSITSRNTILLEVPDGGDGGDGGDVYFRSTGRLSSLYDLRRAHFYGNNGKYGLVSLMILILKLITKLSDFLV